MRVRVILIMRAGRSSWKVGQLTVTAIAKLILAVGMAEQGFN